MREMRIPKGDGRVRLVYCPSRRERRRLQRLLPLLAQAERAAARALGTEAVAHGFVQGRSPVTCALPHVGYPVTICSDLADWFDSVRPEQICYGLRQGGADPALAERVCYLGAPRQGLPTSPTAANLAAVELDRLILARLQALRLGFAYTRYADDLSVSLRGGAHGFSLATLVTMVQDVLAYSVHNLDWSLAPGKTHIQYARAGRRVIVGVSVGESDIRAPRRVRRKLRAARHTRSHGSDNCGCVACHHRRAVRGRSAAGLAEWCRMKLPRACRGSRRIMGVASGPGPAAPPAPVAPLATINGATLIGSRRILLS